MLPKRKLTPIPHDSNESEISPSVPSASILPSAKKRRQNPRVTNQSSTSIKEPTTKHPKNDLYGPLSMGPELDVPVTEQSPSKNTRRRLRSTQAWTELTPKLVYPLLRALSSVSNGTGTTPMAPVCCQGCDMVSAKVNVVSFESMLDQCLYWARCGINCCFPGTTLLLFEYCNCTPAPVALLNYSVYPSTPTRVPQWGFDIKFLEFARLHFMYGSPNVSALCNTSADFLAFCKATRTPSFVSQSVLGFKVI